MLPEAEARASHDDYIGTEHLLLGLIAEDDDPPSQVLQRLGLEARRNCTAIGTSTPITLVWGLSRQTDATATRALARMGATPEQIREQLLLVWGL